MHAFAALGYGKRLSPCRRDQIQLADLLVLLSRGFALAACAFAIGHKRNPAAIGRPFWLAVVAGPRELSQVAARVQPQIFSEDALVPVGAFRADDNRVAVRRNSRRVDID